MAGGGAGQRQRGWQRGRPRGRPRGRALGLLAAAAALAIAALPAAAARSVEQARYDTAYACEGKTLKIECRDGELIHLIRANYGRFSITICNDHGNTEWSVNCMSHKSLRVLHNRCSQQQNCSILASTSMFGDPCPGTLKYLEAHYQCMPAATTTTTSRPSPPWLITSQPSVWSTAKSLTLRPAPKAASTSAEAAAATPAPAPPPAPAPAPAPAPEPAPAPAPQPAPAPAPRPPQPSPPPPSPPPLASTPPPSQPPPPSTQPPTPAADARSSRRPSAAPTTAATDAAPSAPWLPDGELAQLCAPATERGLYWNWTWAGEVAVQPCPGGATGLARWRCSPGLDGAPASWRPESPDLSECRSVWLTSLEDRVNDGDSITSIASDLAQVTKNKPLYGGDMMTTTKIIMKMAKKMSADIQTFPDPRQREAYVTELLNGVVRTGSNLLDTAQHPSWKDLSYKEQMRVATSLLTGLEESAFLVANTVVQEKTVIQHVKNILLSVRVVKTRNVGMEQFPLPATLEVWRPSQDWLQLPRGALLENSEGGLVRLVFVAFDRLERILQPPGVRDATIPGGGGNATRVLNTKVISASLGKGRHIQLSEPVRLFLRHLRTENVTNPSCVFWDYSESAWSDEGCRVEHSNLTHTLCQCNHLTNFAVLMDVHDTYLTPSHQMALQIITYIGCIISVVCLVLTIVTFQLFQGLKSDRTTIHKNLCVCLLVAEILFLAGIGQTENQMVCGLVAGLLHFFFLCAFAWMFLEGFQLYVMLIEVFEAEKSRIRWYYMFAYGAPLIIVAVSCIVDLPSYGTERYCWLRADNFFIFSFVGPVIAVILANLVFLSMAIYMMCRHANASASMKSKEHSRLASASGKEENALQNRLQSHLAWLRGAIVLVFLLGLTWTFGLLYLNEESVIMAYIFTVLNSLQGLFIFVFHCVQNEKVRKEYKKFIRRQSWLPKCLRCSKRSNNKERRSSFYAGSNGNPSAPNSHSTDSSALSPHGTSWRRWSSHSRRGGQLPPPGPPCPGPPRPPPAPWRAPPCPGQGPGPSRGARAGSGGATDAENISFKSYSRDSGHGGSEQEDSPRSHSAVTAAAAAGVAAGLPVGSLGAGSLRPKERRTEGVEVASRTLPAHAHSGGRRRGAARAPSPWNHTYTEIRDGRGAPALALAHAHAHALAHAHDDDPVYEEIERSDVQVSDMSDEDARRQSDVSRQSSRSYGDHRPLIPCLPAHMPALAHAQFLYPEARTVAVLDGETVVCHLRPELYVRAPCGGRSPHYSEC